MQVSSGSTGYATQSLQALLASLQSKAAQSPEEAGQDFPGAGKTGKPSGPPPGGPPPGPPPSGASDKFSSDTLASLLEAQEDEAPSAADVAKQILSSLDTDGDGQLSLEEATKALSDASGKDQDVSSPFAKLDTDGDGKLTAGELTTALSAYQQNQAARYAQRPPPEAMTAEVAA